MALAAADHDQVDAALLRDAHDVRLDVAGLHDALAVLETEPLRELRDPLPGALDQLALDLHGRQQGLAHGLDRHVLDHVQQRDLGAVALRDPLATRRDGVAVVRQVHAEQDLLVFAHGRPGSPDGRIIWCAGRATTRSRA